MVLICLKKRFKKLTDVSLEDVLQGFPEYLFAISKNK